MDHYYKKEGNKMYVDLASIKLFIYAANHYLLSQLGKIQVLVNLQDLIRTLAGKLKVNITETKVGIKSCRLY